MSIDLKLGTDGDIMISNYDLVLTGTFSESARNKILVGLKTFRGEWFLDGTKGIPYIEEVFIKNPDYDAIYDYYKTVILSVPEVSELLSFNAEFDGPTRTLSIEFRARLINGSIFDFVDTVAIGG